MDASAQNTWRTVHIAIQEKRDGGIYEILQSENLLFLGTLPKQYSLKNRYFDAKNIKTKSKNIPNKLKNNHPNSFKTFFVYKVVTNAKIGVCHKYMANEFFPHHLII
jgi:hypothetical protein